MFSKKTEYRPENPGIQENIERIRQRMVANIMPTHAQSGPAEPSLEQDIAERGGPAPIGLERQTYDSADQNLKAATTAYRQIDADNLQADLRRGAWASLRNAVRRSLKWYTDPSEQYWQSLTAGLDHVVTSLKAHEAVLHIHADAVRGSQEKYSDLANQLKGIRTEMPAQSSSRVGVDTKRAD
jgi:hypothetical protein